VFASANVTAQYIQATNGLKSADTIQATGAITTGTTVQAQQISATNGVQSGTVQASGAITAGTTSGAQQFQATNGVQSGTVQASGAITAGTTSGAQQFQATNSVQSSGTVQATQSITSGGTISAQRFQATNNVQSSSNIATQSIVVYGAISAAQYQGIPAGVTQVNGLGGGTISSAVTVQGTLQATQTITGGSLSTAGTVQATQTITGGSLSTAGTVQATQGITSGGTISAQRYQATNNVQSANVATTSLLVTGAISAAQYQGIPAGVTQVNGLGGGTISSAVTVQGAVIATGDVIAYYQVSDDRLKNRVGNIQEALEKVNKINGFTFTYNEEARTHGFDERLHVGVSAQELEQVLPEVVRPFSFENSESKFKRVEYEKIIPLLVESIKELTTRVEQLEDLTKSLKTE
jgi:hypothetical protein